MPGFRVVYHQGSFAFAEACRSHEEAVSHALSVKRRTGVWFVRVEDEQGRAAPQDRELERCSFHGCQ